MSGTARRSSIPGLLRDVGRQEGRALRITAALMAAGALAEAAGLLILLPMLSLVAGQGGAVVRAVAAILPAATRLPVILLAFLLIMVVRAAILFARDRASARLETAYEQGLRVRAAATLASRGWPFAAQVGQAGMQGLLDNDVPRSMAAVHYGLSAATATFMLVVQLAVAALLSWPMALGAALLLLLAGPFVVALARRSAGAGVGIIERQQDSVRAAYRFYAGLKAAIAQGSVPAFLTAYEASLARLRGDLLAFATGLARSRARHQLAAAVAAASIIGVGQALALDLPHLLALLVLFARMSGPAQMLQQAAVNLAANAPAFATIETRLAGVLDRPSPVEPAAPLEWQRLEANGLALDRGIGCRSAPTDFVLNRGEWVAISGDSGAGKTTLIDLVAGLIAPSSGQLMVDGKPLEGALLAGWRAGLAYVGQQEAPFDDTLRAALGDGHDDDLMTALEIVGLADMVRALPLALATKLADRGDRFSGGERQRLMIARALLRSPRLLLLDEATAALDTEGERALVLRIRAARPELAALLVAHRIESSALCDRTVTVVRSPA